MNISPEKIFLEYSVANRFKASIGKHGLYEQNRINERFFIGDQWHGAAVGKDRPLVRHNVIKRIGEYKIAELLGSAVSVKYTAEGVASADNVKAKMSEFKKNKRGSADINLMLSALNSYHNETAERVGLSSLLEQALRDAYIRGTGAVYTYFDPDIRTGLFAGDKPILGDIVSETVKIEDIFFADEKITDI